jgi:hypothetical protein
MFFEIFISSPPPRLSEEKKKKRKGEKKDRNSCHLCPHTSSVRAHQILKNPPP